MGDNIMTNITPKEAVTILEAISDGMHNITNGTIEKLQAIRDLAHREEKSSFSNKGGAHEVLNIVPTNSLYAVFLIMDGDEGPGPYLEFKEAHALAYIRPSDLPEYYFKTPNEDQLSVKPLQFRPVIQYHGAMLVAYGLPFRFIGNMEKSFLGPPLIPDRVRRALEGYLAGQDELEEWHTRACPILLENNFFRLATPPTDKDN